MSEDNRSGVDRRCGECDRRHTPDRRHHATVDDNDPVDDEFELEVRVSYHRRRMAYGSMIFNAVLISVILFYVGIGKYADLTDAILDFLTWAFLGNVSIVGAFMGLETWAQVKKP